MIGILLVSHGEMAKGMHNSAKMFFSDEIESFDYLCFKEEMVIDDFDNQINKKLKEIIYVFLTIFLYLLKCPQILIL